ncbi:MAG TPA: AMP-binding protein, partial [Fimbriimonas sp.]|nr:AMP-binding protein [Fimbriimonas sp.]
MSETIDSLLHENRKFVPSPEFVAQANANDPAIYEEAFADPVGWWEGWADKLDWFKKWDTAVDFQVPYAKWFLGGKLNVAYNCVDRHANGSRSDKPAIIFEGEPGDSRTLTFSEVKDEVSRIANALKAMGVKKGDRVCIYMPMVPELPMTMLACARIGAAHTVVFGGFSADSLQERTNDASAKVIVTADGGWRRGNVVQLKKITDEAMALGCPTVEKILVLERTGAATGTVNMVDGRDIWWNDLVTKQSTDCPCEEMDAEDLLFILYTSGSTGKPKGITHATGGYLTGVSATSKLVFDHKEDDIHFCTADCGWITGH